MGQCEYRLMAESDDGTLKPAKIPTRWATTSAEMAARLSKRCSKDHARQALMGGRAAAAAFHSPKLQAESLRGIRDTDGRTHEPSPEHPQDLSYAMSTAGAFHDLPADPVLADVHAEELVHRNLCEHTTLKNDTNGPHKTDLQSST